MNRNWLRVAAVVTAPAGVAVFAGAVLGRWAGAVLAVAVVLFVAALALFMANRVPLSAMRARPVGEVEYPQLYRVIRELSKAARLPVPRIYVSPALQPNSFAVGHSRRAVKVCCTEGLLRLLTEDELRGVLGHELAHVREHDTVATSFGAGLAAVIASLASPAWLVPAGLSSLTGSPHRGPALGVGRLGFLGRPDTAEGAGRPEVADTAESGRPQRVPTGTEPEGTGVAAALAMLVVGPAAGLLLQLLVSRRREYRADALGATLAGDPLALARALRKIEARTVELPLSLTGPLASASPLMIVNPFSGEGFTRLFSTHPPTGERVFRLEGLAGYPR